MAGETAEIPNLALNLTESDVWAALGPKDRAVSGLTDDITGGIELAYSVCKPRGLYTRLAISEVGRKSVSFVDGLELPGSFMAHCFEGATEAMFVMASVGSGLEKQVAQLFAEGNSVEAFILDAVASAAIFNVFSQVTTDVCRLVTGRGEDAGMCLSPGQSYWDVTGLRDIFQVVPGERIDVTLTETCFMLPRKSEAGVIPMGSDLKVHADPSQSNCRYCQAKNCPLRQEAPSAI